MLFFLITLHILYVNADLCGPEGYYAGDLLSPSYWYFDILNDTQCPPMSKSSFINNISNQTGCRIYFNLCNDMIYQCSGTVCARYLQTQDYVIILGQYDGNPFDEDSDSFHASYQGEQLFCGKNDLKTVIKFNCDKKSIWNKTVSKEHGGAMAPQPLVSFDHNLCQYSMVFNNSNACYVVPKNDAKSRKISNGSFMLMLVIPGFALYMLLGILFNLARGKRGKFLIPHLEFWTQLPDLIMDGFAFTMATITCRHEDRFTQEYKGIE